MRLLAEQTQQKYTLKSLVERLILRAADLHEEFFLLAQLMPWKYSVSLHESILLSKLELTSRESLGLHTISILYSKQGIHASIDSTEMLYVDSIC